MLFFGIRSLMASRQERRFSPPRLLLPKPLLKAGETTSISFQRLPKGENLLPHNIQLHARLVKLEVVKRWAGTDIIYDYEVLYEEALDTKNFFAGQSQLNATWSVSIPADAKPYAESKEHWVFWQFQVFQERPKQDPWVSKFTLPIA